ncbi:MAG TPA: hypothetical protein VFD08_04650 [Clostridia bacterium]|nr:hypothetical protein [Clostridia bacterium]
MKNWSKNERRLFSFSLVLLLLLSGKSVFFDGYKALDKKESKVMQLALEETEVKPWIHKKVVKVKALDPQHYENISMTHGYLVVVRKYFLGIVPIGESRVLE